jgi:Flp pilus assembly protein TadG
MAITHNHHDSRRSLRRDERGFSLVTFGFSFIALFGATMLAIDVGMLMTARTQAQTSADAGALAGATALVFNSWTNRTATGPSVSNAIDTSKKNLVAGSQVSVIPADVNFPYNPTTSQSDLVEVSVYRNSARENPVSTLIASLPIFGMETVDVSATATAWAAPADSAMCVLPLTIPDKWQERSRCGSSTCTWNPDDTFDVYASKGNNQNAGEALAVPDIYYPPGTTNATGYSPITDRGVVLTLKPNNQNKIAPSMYNAWRQPGSEGADDYREAIAGCNPNLVDMGELMEPETGNMVGPTEQGAQESMAKDPNAYWDTGCNCVKGSAFGVSPRIRVVPLYNPTKYMEGQHSGHAKMELEVVNYLGFFIEDIKAGEIKGRITPITGTLRDPSSPPIGGFAYAIILVK